MNSWNYRAIHTPEGVRIEIDPQTGAPIRLELDGVEFVPKKMPERESWKGWPRLAGDPKLLRVHFA